MFRDPSHWPFFKAPIEQRPPELPEPRAGDLAQDVAQLADRIEHHNALLRDVDARAEARKQMRNYSLPQQPSVTHDR